LLVTNGAGLRVMTICTSIFFGVQQLWSTQFGPGPPRGRLRALIVSHGESDLCGHAGR
jgi:hypothetical protein